MKTSKKTRVLIVDDHPVVRAGLRSIAEVDKTLEITGEAANAAEAVLMSRNLRPNILLLDVRLPDRSGFDVCREIKSARDAPFVLFLTSFADNALVLKAMESGAEGYLLKENEPHQIARAIQKICAGGTIFDAIPASILENPDDNFAHRKKLLQQLSPQEMRVLAEVSKGKTDKETAGVLGLQVKTVRHYLDSVFAKLGVNTRTQAAMLWISRDAATQFQNPKPPLK